jgi:hypothetical protein
MKPWLCRMSGRGGPSSGGASRPSSLAGYQSSTVSARSGAPLKSPFSRVGRDLSVNLKVRKPTA